jgi:hypothetical protein
MNIYKQLYVTALPMMSIYSIVIGIDTGINASKRKPDETAMNVYSTIIGYTGLGILTGITYPISYPLFGSYVLYKMNKK